MSKAGAGAVVAMFMMGAGVMTLLGSVPGPYAEAATLTLVGVGLFAGSSMLGGGKVTAGALPQRHGQSQLTRLSVSEICFRWGVNGSDHFSRVTARRAPSGRGGDEPAGIEARRSSVSRSWPGA